MKRQQKITVCVKICFFDIFATSNFLHFSYFIKMNAIIPVIRNFKNWVNKGVN